MRSLSLREKRLIQVAILLAIVVLLSLLLRGGGEGLPPAPAPARTAAVPGPAASAPADSATPAPAAAPTPASAPAGLRLHGLLASGAVISTANGGQRLVAVGREVAPGLTLVRIEQHHAVLRGAGGEFRLGFDGTAPSALVSPAPAPSP